MPKDSPPRMHHFLSQGYLRGFTNHGHRDGKGCVRCVDLIDRTCVTARPNNVAKVRDYYVFQNLAGQPDYSVETKIFDKVDSDTARIFREIDTRRALPVGEDWQNLAAIVAFLDLRTPHFRQVNQELAQDHFDFMAQARFGSREAYESWKIKEEAKSGKKVDYDYEAIREDIDKHRLVVEVPRTNQVKMMLDLSLQTMPIIYEMTPHLLVAEGKARFITGDAPVCLWDTDEERRRAGLLGVGWLSEGVEATIPLTSRCCLALNRDGKSKRVVAKEADVAFYNSLRAHKAHRRLYFSPSDEVAVLDKNDDIVWGDAGLLDCFADLKLTQYAIEVRGPFERRPPERSRRY